METSGEALSTRKIVIMIAVVCIVGFLILNGPGHDNGSVRSFIGQRTDQVSTDVLNGIQVTDRGRFSSVVGISMARASAPADIYTCTGVLLSRHDVLTAGHCCDGFIGFHVHVGLQVISTTPLPVASVLVMPGYRYDSTKDANNQTIETPEKDLCMLTLASPVGFWPERIYVSRTKPKLGTLVDIVGFGMIASDTETDDLHYAETVVAGCNKALNWARNKARVEDDIVCAGHGAIVPRRVAQNACSGDSGGPLLSPKQHGDARMLYGILSDGDKPCRAGKNSYTDVSKQEFFDFIRHNSRAMWMPSCRSRP